MNAPLPDRLQRRRLLAGSALMLAGGRCAFAAAHAAKPVSTRVETPFGDLVIAVDLEHAPVTAANYLAYVDRGLLDHASVYRIVTPTNQPPDTRFPIEVVQWGMNNPDDQAPPLPAIAHETTRQTGLRHRDGTVSMARNGPGTAAAEYFICIGDQPELDFGGHRNPDGLGFAAFGQVVAGRSVLRAIYAQAQLDPYLKPPIPLRSVRRVASRT